MGIVRSDRKVGYFPSYILNRISLNKNFLCCITGGTGSGKSYSALRLGEVLDPNFDIRNVLFEPKEFMDLVKGESKKLKRGAVIIWDELQVKMGNLDYQSLQAKCINFVLQTFRYKGFILIVTSPHFSFINAGARKLFHSRIETISINENTKKCILKPFLLQVNQNQGDVYQKYLRVVKDGSVMPVSRMAVGLASPELIKAYEEKKDNFTSRLYDEISNDLAMLDERDRKKPLTKQQESIVKLLQDGKIIPDVVKELGIKQSQVYQQISYIKKKGVTIEPVKEGFKVVRYSIGGL